MTRSIVHALVLIGSLGMAACASLPHDGVPTPFPNARPASWSVTVAPKPGELTDALVATALALEGQPYRFGGNEPESGLDCSGLVRYVFLQQHILVPRTVAEQFDAGTAVSLDAVEPGDLVFFSTERPGPSHVGILVAPDTFIHAPGTGRVIRTERLSATYWRARVLGARRVG